MWGHQVDEVDGFVLVWLARAFVALVAFVGMVTGLKFILGTVIFAYRVWQLIRGETSIVKESGVSTSETTSDQEPEEKAWHAKWLPFVKVSAIYIGLVAVSLSSVHTVWRNLRGLLRLFEVAIPEGVYNLVDSVWPKLDFGVWDYTRSWASGDKVECLFGNASDVSLQWDAAEKAYAFFANNPNQSDVSYSFGNEYVASGKPFVASGRLGLGHAPGSCHVRFVNEVAESRANYKVVSGDSSEAPRFYECLTFTFTRDRTVEYKVDRLGWLNTRAVYIAVSIVIIAAVFYYYYCFYKGSVSRMKLVPESRSKVNKSQWKKKQHEVASPSDSGTDDEGFTKVKPDWMLPDDHKGWHKECQTECSCPSYTAGQVLTDADALYLELTLADNCFRKHDGKKNPVSGKPALKGEALHSVVTSTKALEKVKKIKKEAAVASSPTIPSTAMKSCVCVEVILKSDATKTHKFTGFAATVKGAGQLEVPPVQAIICPATHGMIAADAQLEAFVLVPEGNGYRRVPVTVYKTWTYKVGKEQETGTSFLYTGGGLKMFKAPLTNALIPNTSNQGLLYSALTGNVSGGSIRLEDNGFIISQIATQPGDSGAFIWSTVLNESRTALTVPVGIHIGNNGANVAVPIAVALKAVNFQ